MTKVLITGGSGLLGGRLTSLLKVAGHEVVHLGRASYARQDGVRVFKWDYKTDYLDSQALDGVEVIVHLAGAGVAERRWTQDRKAEIIESRVKTAQLLYHAVSGSKGKLKAIVSASAVGWYGDGGATWQIEEQLPGAGFLADTCRKWEAAIQQFSKLDLRECRMRIGVILSNEGGALPQMDKPVRLGIGAYTGSGRQYIPWIHIDDVCGLFIKAITDEHMQGAYNTVAPNPVTAKDFTRAIAVTMGKPFIPVPGPAFALRIVLGEMADVVLLSNRVCAKKAEEAGYVFRFPQLSAALDDLYRK